MKNDLNGPMSSTEIKSDVVRVFVLEVRIEGYTLVDLSLLLITFLLSPEVQMSRSIDPK